MAQVGFKAITVAGGFGVFPEPVFAQRFVDSTQCCNASGGGSGSRREKVEVATRFVVKSRALVVADAAGQALHGILNLAHQFFHAQAGFAHAGDKFTGEYAVGVAISLAQAVQRLLATAGRIHDHLAFGRIWRIQAPGVADGAGAAGGLEGVVAAGIDHDQAECRLGLGEVLHHVAQRIRGLFNL